MARASGIPPEKPEVRGQAGATYQLVLSGWGVAAVIAGLSSLLENDMQMRAEQRIVVTAMITDMRKTLKGEDA